MTKARLVTPITLGSNRTFPCVRGITPTNIGFVDTEPSTQPVWLLYPVCFPDADLVQKLYAASDRPLHEVMAQRLKRPGESKE